MKTKILVISLSIGIAIWVLSSGYGSWEKELGATMNVTAAEQQEDSAIQEVTANIDVLNNTVTQTDNTVDETSMAEPTPISDDKSVEVESSLGKSAGSIESAEGVERSDSLPVDESTGNTADSTAAEN